MTNLKNNIIEYYQNHFASKNIQFHLVNDTLINDYIFLDCKSSFESFTDDCIISEIEPNYLQVTFNSRPEDLFFLQILLY